MLRAVLRAVVVQHELEAKLMDELEWCCDRRLCELTLDSALQQQQETQQQPQQQEGGDGDDDDFQCPRRRRAPASLSAPTELEGSWGESLSSCRRIQGHAAVTIRVGDRILASRSCPVSILSESRRFAPRETSGVSISQISAPHEEQGISDGAHRWLGTVNHIVRNCRGRILM